jgi:manganese/zinc/iron transport system permease protein
MYELIVEPWYWGAFMWRGMLAAVLSSVMLSVVGVFLYLRRMSLLADALAHVALPGIVAAYLLTGSVHPLVMLAGATATGLLASVAIEGLANLPNVRSDAAIGIVFTSMFAVGVIAISRYVRGAHIDTQCVLYGNVLGISNTSLWLLGVTCPVVVIGVLVAYRWLTVSSFDPTLAASLGVPTGMVHYGLMTGTSMATVASFEAVGAILAIAMIIVPAATAHLLCDRLPAMLAVAVGHGLLSAVLGMYASVWFNCSTAGAMVVVGGGLYAIAFMLAPTHGWVWRARRRRGERASLPETEVVSSEAQ